MSRREFLVPLAQAAYVPTLFAEFGIGAMFPVFALSALALGESVAIASLAVVVYGLGRIPGSALGGRLAHALGGSQAALVGMAVLALGAAGAALSQNVWALAITITVIGIGHGAYHVARQAQVNAIAPHWFRARSLTTLAGTWRIANFAGPIVGAAVIGLWGMEWVYAMAAVAAGVAMLALVLAPHWRDRAPAVTARASGSQAPDAPDLPPAPQGVRVIDVIRRNATIFRTLGVAVVLTVCVRAARVVVIPLWAVHVGLSPQVASLIFGIAAAIDMVLFYPAGAVSDRWGRAWSAIPSTIAITVGSVALIFAHSAWAVAVCALIIGAGNGWGSGVLMTLAVDVAPAGERDLFVGGFTVFQEVGGVVGPLLVAASVAVSLPLGLLILGGLGTAASLTLWRWIPPWTPDAVMARRGQAHPPDATP